MRRVLAYTHYLTFADMCRFVPDMKGMMSWLIEAQSASNAYPPTVVYGWSEATCDWKMLEEG